MISKKWIVAKEPPEKVKKSFPELPGIILHLLNNRGITTQEAVDEFLNPDYGQDTHNPFLFQDMQRAVDRIDQARQKKEKITVHGDYDADGVCSSALLVTVLKDLGLEVEVFLPHRAQEGYGLSMDAIAEIKDNGTSLLITTDCGITNIEEVKKANELGLEVIITDHHQVMENLPPALAILNPNVKDEKYPFKRLAGVGVAFKLACALAQKYPDVFSDGYEKWLLDFVAISTVTDMMPLLGENRTLVKYGLIVLQKTRRIGITKLIEVCRSYNGELNTHTIGFQIGPRINAAGRMDHANAAYLLMMSKTETEAGRLAKELDQANSKRRQMTEQYVQLAEAQIPDQKGEDVYFVGGKDWPHGLLGLISGRISDKYNRPAFAYSAADQEITASGRSIDAFNITEALEELADYFSKFGGHPQACGFTLKEDKSFDELQDKFKQYAKEKLSKEDFVPVLDIDTEVELDQINWELYELLDKFEPFGEGNPKPVYLAHNLEIVSSRLVGSDNKHVKLRFKSAKGKEMNGIAFGFGSRAGDCAQGNKVDVAFNVDVNEWNGQRNLEMKVVDIKKT